MSIVLQELRDLGKTGSKSSLQPYDFVALQGMCLDTGSATTHGACLLGQKK